MAISGCMQCLKTCGYLCGILAALNIWFWLGMTVFNAMGNPWITKEILLYDDYLDPDASRFTAVFGACIGVSDLISFYFFESISDFSSVILAQCPLHDWLLLLHQSILLLGQRQSGVLCWWRRSARWRLQLWCTEDQW